MKQHTLIFVPHARAEHGKWRLRKWRLSTLQAALALGGLAFFALGGLVAAIAAFDATVDREELARLEEENAALSEVNRGFAASVDVLA